MTFDGKVGERFTVETKTQYSMHGAPEHYLHVIDKETGGTVAQLRWPQAGWLEEDYKNWTARVIQRYILGQVKLDG